MQIGITGSSGFIGSELVNYFLAKGEQVVLLQRKNLDSLPGNVSYLHFDLAEETVPDISSLDVLIHTAYMPFINNSSSQKNIRASLSLSEACTKNGAQFIFLSSMSAHENALSEYGKHKFEIEKHLDKSSSLILKLGLVLGKQGLFSRIKKTIGKSKFIPLIGGGKQPVQTVLISDVLKTIDHCIQRKISGTYSIATPEIYSMKEVIEAIANSSNQKPFFIPAPYFIAETAIQLIELLHLPFPVSKENLFGLKQMKAFDTKNDLQTLGIELNNLQQSIAQL